VGGARTPDRRQVTAHTLLFARENFATMPTTDLIELGGSFRRAGARERPGRRLQQA
jgi:hypothetical protein